MLAIEENKILRFLIQWHKEEIYHLLLKLFNNLDHEPSLDEILQYLNDLPFSSLYQDMINYFEWEEIIEAFAFIFENDPSCFRNSPKSINSFMNELPFPRYIVGICYIMIYGFFDREAYLLREPVWNNILNQNPVFASPRLISGSLQKLFEPQELLERSVELLGQENGNWEFYGDILIYKRDENITLQEVINCLQEKLKTERNQSRIRKYKRKYLIEKLGNRLDSIATWVLRI
ncbi:hypothetical protein [Lusitaniella coriacea]|uniref:hypothetical protein n=1 Tax=Lusitaniella coriacea TaxID=1983105 RepID=UPI003CE9217A